MTRSFLVIRNKRSERLHYWVASIFYVDSLGGLRSVYVHQKFRYEVFWYVYLHAKIRKEGGGKLWCLPDGDGVLGVWDLSYGNGGRGGCIKNCYNSILIMYPLILCRLKKTVPVAELPLHNYFRLFRDR